jgi:hypothetical protein
MPKKQPEKSNAKNTEDQQRTNEERDFILSVLKEAIISAGVKSVAEYKGEPLTNRWHLFFREYPTDIILKMIVFDLFGTINADISLLLPAKWIIDEIKTALNQPDANLLFDITDEDHPEMLRENAQMILTALIKRIPTVAVRFLSQSLAESFQWHITTHIEPRLKEHWQSLGKPKDFTITFSKEFTEAIQSTNEQFEVLRKELLGDKKARLTDERRANLDKEHEELRVAYQGVKDYYDQSRKAFFAGQRGRDRVQWKEEWETLSLHMYPNLHYQCLYEINDYQPFELAHKHLADFYGRAPSYMVKLVGDAAGLKRKTRLKTKKTSLKKGRKIAIRRSSKKTQ